MENFRPELFVIALVGFLAPLLSELPARFRLPVVAIKILLGIAIGPQLLNLASPDGLGGAPVLLYRQSLAEQDRLPFALYSATGLPLIVIITELGISSGLMPADRAAVLVYAGMISVLMFPLLVGKARRESKAGP